nr:5'-3' exonuclease H3TH domain-containing protein [Angustibacter aerolatus]
MTATPSSLVDEGTTVLYPVRGVSEPVAHDPGRGRGALRPAPERYPDLAALVGESSDNLPGVPGVGPKTAAKWINLYGGLQGVVANVDQIKGKAGDNLREHLEGVLRNRRLNGLVRDLEPAAEARRPRAPPVGPRRGAPGLRRPRVPGAARAAVRHRRGGAARGRVGLRPERRAAHRGGGRRVAGRARERGLRCGVDVVGAGVPAPATRTASPWPRPTGTPPTSTSSRWAPTASRRWPGGWRTPTGPRRCTTRRAPATRSPLAGCRCRAW